MWVPDEQKVNEHAFQKRSWAHAANVAATGCNEQCFDDTAKMEFCRRELELQVCCPKLLKQLFAGDTQQAVTVVADGFRVHLPVQPVCVSGTAPICTQP